MRKLKPRLTYANVIATAALIIAVAGGTTAIAISTKLKKGSVSAKTIRNGNVTAPKLAGVRVVSGVQGNQDNIASCAASERLIGGGIQGTPVSPGSVPSVLSSYPSGNSWIARGSNNANVVAYALCLSAKPGS